jgi:transposase-like protein
MGREAVVALESAQLIARLSPEERANLAAMAFDAASATELLAAVTQYVSGVASAVGVSVHSLEPSVDSSWAGAGVRVVIDVSLSSPGAELLRLLDELATSPRLSVVERLDVRLRSTEIGPSEREMLTASMRVVAFGSKALGDGR